MKTRLSLMGIPALLLVFGLFSALAACDSSGGGTTTPSGDVPHSITVTVTDGTTGNGAVTASASSAKKGTEITLTAIPADRKKLAAWKWNETDLSTASNTASFTMPDADVVVTATFEDLAEDEYQVKTPVVTSNGTVSPSPAYGKAGDTITLTAAPNTGWKLSSWKWNETDLPTTSNTVAFTMPAQDVTVTAVFVKENYAITLVQPAHGELDVFDTSWTALPEPKQAQYGDRLFIDGRGEDGYILKSVSVTGAGGSSVAVTKNSSDYEFRMPAEPVTVSGEFVTPITMAGTITLNNLTDTDNHGYLRFYSDSQYRNQVARADLDLSNGSSVSWSADFAEAGTYYADVSIPSGWIVRKIANPIIVPAAGQTGVNLGAVDFSVVTASGTITININGATAEYGWLNFYSDSQYRNEVKYTNITFTNGSPIPWSAAFDEAGIYYVEAQIQPQNGGSIISKKIAAPIVVPAEGANNIDLGSVDFNVVTASGTITININGATAEYGWLNFYSDSQYRNYVKDTPITFTSGSPTSWSALFDEAGTYYIAVQIAPQNGGSGITQKIANPITVPAEGAGNIDLGTVTIGAITLSGTANVTSNKQIDEVEIVVYTNADCSDDHYVGGVYYYDGNPYYGTWSMPLSSFDTPTTLYFRVYIGRESSWVSKKIPVSVQAFNSDISGIALGSVNFDVKTITGSLKNNGSPVTDARGVRVIDRSAANLAQYDAAITYGHNWNGTDSDGKWATDILSEASEGYFVIHRGDDIYVSKQKTTGISASTPINLDLANFNLLTN